MSDLKFFNGLHDQDLGWLELWSAARRLWDHLAQGKGLALACYTSFLQH